jgi:stress response protein YsnF
VVEHHPVDRPATPADADAFQGRVLEVETKVEVPVVAKEVVVVEEVVLHKEVAERVDTVRDTVRRTAVEVEPDPVTLPTPGATHP